MKARRSSISPAERARGRAQAFGVLLAAFLFPAGARASPVDLSVDHTPQGQLTVAPYFYVYNSPGDLTGQLYLLYGLSKQLDFVLAGGGELNLSPRRSVGPYVQETYLRWFFLPEVALVAQLNWYPSKYIETGLGLDIIKYWTHWSIAVNAWYHPRYDFVSGWAPGDLTVYCAPEYYFNNYFSVYFEVDPSLTWHRTGEGGRSEQAATIALVPGIWIGLPTVRKQSISIGVGTTFPYVGPSSVSVGLWYAVAINQPP